MKNLMVAIAILTLAACAHNPTAPKASLSEKTTAPTFSEKVSAQSIRDVKSANCEKPGEAQSKEWRMMIPFANACVKAGQWDQVEKIADSFAKKFPLTPWGPYYFSLSAEAKNDLPRAVWMMDLALKKSPNEGLFYYQMGRLQWAQGNAKEAMQALTTACDKNPNLVDAQVVLAQIAMSKNESGQAERRLKLALEQDGRNFEGLLTYAQLQLRAKNWSEAESLLIRAQSVAPRSLKVRLALIQLQETHLQKFREALNGYRQLKQMTQSRQLDETLQINVDERIQALEKSVAQVRIDNTESARKPTSERKTAQ